MITTYWCSECGRPIGLMLDSQGFARSFFCHHTGRVAEMIGYIGKSKSVEVAAE